MSTTIQEIIEKLKTINLLEASELVSQIEETFGVDASASTGIGFAMPAIPAMPHEEKQKEVVEEQTSFDVILEDIASGKRIAVLKVIRNLTSLGVLEAKEVANSLPHALKESVSKEEAEKAKQQLEEAGAKVKIQ